MKVRSQILVVAVLAAGGAAAWYYADQNAGDTSAAGAGAMTGGRALPVVAVQVRIGSVTVTVEAVGTAQANEAVTITPRRTATVQKIAFVEGERVSAGEVLVELDSSEFRANLEEMRAIRDEAKSLHDRARALYQNRHVSRARVDTLFAALRAAEAKVKADEARLAEFVIRAPFAGRLGLRRVSVGALVTPGTVITTLDDTRRIKVDFRVPETALAHMRPGLPIYAQSASFPDRTFAGRVQTIDTRIDPVTRSIELRASIPNREELLKPGMFLTARLSLATRDDAILVPEEAIISSGTDQFVFVVAGGKAVKTRVTLGQRGRGEVEITDGLEPGALVITRGLQKVRTGMPVKVSGAAPLGSAPALARLRLTGARWFSPTFRSSGRCWPR